MRTGRRDQGFPRSALVDDLLELTRLQAGRVQLALRCGDLRDVVAHAAAAIEPHALTTRQRVTVALPAVPVGAMIDEPRLGQALLNLLGNAHKYGVEGGKIEARLERRNEEAVLSIADDGPGIPVEEQERISQRFYRGEAPVGHDLQAGGQGSVPGSGLGLAIARAMVDLHGGRLWVESKAGCSATFRIALPLHCRPGNGTLGPSAPTA